MKKIFLSLFFVIMLSCQSTKNVEFNSGNVIEYNNYLKWKRFHLLKKFVEKDPALYQSDIEKKHKDITIENFKILKVEKLSDKKYKIVIDREEIILPSNILKVNRYTQYWIYKKSIKKWVIEQEIKNNFGKI